MKMTEISESLLEPSPNWCMDCTKMPALLDNGFAVQGFHPSMGHILVANNYGFTQMKSRKCSILIYGRQPIEFDNSQMAAEWCSTEKVWFLDPHNAYKMIEVE